MISIEQALDAVLARTEAVAGDDCMPVESVVLADSVGRILRRDVNADADSPPFHRSVRDGFAVVSADVAAAPVELEVVGESRAGRSFDGRVAPGQCCEIMTGAEVPDGADAVVMLEDTRPGTNGRVRMLRTVQAGKHVQGAGTECRKGDRVLEGGRRIGAGEIGILASLGYVGVPVSRKPRVAILSTGDELVDVAETPGPAQIRNSNSVSLMAQVVEAGGDPIPLGIAGDDSDDLRAKLSEALRHDVVITSGGVSMGKYDLVEGVLEELGVEIAFEKVAMKPGKPTVFGWREKTFVFGLPGNPVSTIVSFQLFVRPLIRRLLHAGTGRGGFLEAVLDGPVRCDPVRGACVPARARFRDGAYRIAPVRWMGSSDLVGLARANAYLLIPRRDGELSGGDRVRFIPMSTLDE